MIFGQIIDNMVGVMKKIGCVLMALMFVCGLSTGCARGDVPEKQMNETKKFVSISVGEICYFNAENTLSEDWATDDENVLLLEMKENYLRITGLSEGVAEVSYKNSVMYRVIVQGVAGAGFELTTENIIRINLDESEYAAIGVKGVATEKLPSLFAFTSSNVYVACVDNSGIVRGRQSGVAQITIKEKQTGMTRIVHISVSGNRANSYVKTVETGGTGTTNHVQGVATNLFGDIFYYCFTDRLVVQKSNGEIVGSVVGIPGHMGDLAFNPDDGRVYVSYMKIATSDFARQTEMRNQKNAYVLIFDVDKIDRMNMSPDGIVTCVYVGEKIQELANTHGYDYGTKYDDLNIGGKYGVVNALGNLAIGPAFGENDGKTYVTCVLSQPGNALSTDSGKFAYDREDNDYFVIAQFDVAELNRYEVPFSGLDEASGPKDFDGMYFYYAGQHDYGVQVMSYDAYRNMYVLATYALQNSSLEGATTFPNYTTYYLDANKVETGTLIGNGEEIGDIVTEKFGKTDETTGIKGWSVWYDVGFVSLGDGFYYRAESYTDGSAACRLVLCAFNDGALTDDSLPVIVDCK